MLEWSDFAFQKIIPGVYNLGSMNSFQLSRMILVFFILFSGNISACGSHEIGVVTLTSTVSKPVPPTLTIKPFDPTVTPADDKVLVVSVTPAMSSTPGHDWKKILDPVLDAGGVWHVLVRGPNGKIVYEREAGDLIHPASVIKVAIGMLALDWLKEQYGNLSDILQMGPIGAGRSYAQLLKAMLVNSEEEAADLLQKALVDGYGWKRINQRLAEWGAVHTTLVPRRSSAEDMVNLLSDLYEKSTPSIEGSRILLDLLATVSQGDTVRLWKIKSMLPPDAMIFNKRGSLTDPMIVADAGIIQLPDGSWYYLCLFGYPDTKVTFEDLDKTIGDFAVAWYRELVRISE